MYDYFTGSLMYADRQRTTFLNSCHGSELLLSWRPFRARKKSMTLSSFYPSCLRYYQSKFWNCCSWINWSYACMCCRVYCFALFRALIVFVGCWTRTSMPQRSTSSSCCCLWSMRCVNVPSDINLYQVSFLYFKKKKEMPRNELRLIYCSFWSSLISRIYFKLCVW